MNTNYIPYIDRYNGINVNLSKIKFDYEVIQDKMTDVTNHGNQVLVQKKFHLMWDNKYSPEIDLIPYTQDIIDFLQKRIQFNSVTYRNVLPNTCYNWHTDTGGICYHIPIITNNACFFVYEHRNFRMPADGSIYVVNTEKEHTFINAGSEPRIHLTLEVH